MVILLFLASLSESAWAIEETEIFQPLQRHEVIVTGSGELFVVNFPESRVQAYDAAGDLARTIGRKGKGPGEFTFPAQFFHMDGKLYVYDWLESTINVFTSADGTFLDRYKVPHSNVRLAKVTGGWVYGTWGLIAMNQPAEVIWASEDFTETKKLIDIPESGYSSGNWNWNTDGQARAFYSKFSSHPILVTAPDGDKVYLTDRDVFALTIIDAASHSIAGKLERDDRPVPFDEDWAEEGADEVRRERKAAFPNVKFVTNSPEYFPVIRGVIFDPDGNLVVDRWRGRPDGNHNPVTLDTGGNERDQKWPFDVLERIVGVVGAHAYVSCFEEATEEASIVRVPLSKTIAYVRAHPLFTKDHSLTINVD